MRDHSTSGSDVAADALHIVESHEKCDFIAAMGNKSQNATWPLRSMFQNFSSEVSWTFYLTFVHSCKYHPERWSWAWIDTVASRFLQWNRQSISPVNEETLRHFYRQLIWLHNTLRHQYIEAFFIVFLFFLLTNWQICIPTNVKHVFLFIQHVLFFRFLPLEDSRPSSGLAGKVSLSQRTRRGQWQVGTQSSLEPQMMWFE